MYQCSLFCSGEGQVQINSDTTLDYQTHIPHNNCILIVYMLIFPHKGTAGRGGFLKTCLEFWQIVGECFCQ